jgi:uridylate kinase
MGMLATVINALALQDVLEHAGCHAGAHGAPSTRSRSPYIRRRAVRHLEKNRW